MRKRYYAFVGVAGVLAIALALAVAVVVSAQGPAATPSAGGNAKPNQGGIQNRLGNLFGKGIVSNLRNKAQQGAGMQVLSVNGQTITVQARGQIVTITTDANTKFQLADRSASIKDVTPGSIIQVQGTRDSNGNLLATNVQIIPPHASGQITAVNNNALTIKAGQSTQTVKTTSDTTYYLKNQKTDASVAQVGRNAEVFGNLNADGTLTAVEVRVQPMQVAGTISNISGNTITLTRGAWTTTVTTDNNTVYLNGTQQASASDLQQGKNIVVEGFKTSDGKIQATTIHLAPAAGTPRQQKPAPTPSSGQS